MVSPVFALITMKIISVRFCVTHLVIELKLCVMVHLQHFKNLNLLCKNLYNKTF